MAGPGPTQGSSCWGRWQGCRQTSLSGKGCYDRGTAREGLPVTHSCWAFAILGSQTRLQGQGLWLRGLHYDLPHLGGSRCCREEQDHTFGSRRGSKAIPFGSYPRLQAKSTLVLVVLQTLSIHLSLCRRGHQWEQLGWQWYPWIKCYTFINTSGVSYHMIQQSHSMCPVKGPY